MAVRDGLLALLTAGSAYGFQLHGGLAARTGGRRTVNVGQTYATLDRLGRQRLIESAGTTDDGLPLHRLTDAGDEAARAWLGGADAAGADPWDETIDRVLVARSLPGIDSEAVVESEHRRWELRRDAASEAADPVRGGEPGVAAEAQAEAGLAEAGLARLAASAEVARADAALVWLGAVRRAGPLDFAPRRLRPRRGRPPTAAAAATGEADVVSGDDQDSASA